MTGKPLRIILVDDHAVVRMGYKRLLENDPDIEVIAELESGEEANQQARELNPDVMVMDLSMPGMGGWKPFVESRRRIRRFAFLSSPCMTMSRLLSMPWMPAPPAISPRTTPPMY